MQRTPYWLIDYGFHPEVNQRTDTADFSSVIYKKRKPGLDRKRELYLIFTDNQSILFEV